MTADAELLAYSPEEFERFQQCARELGVNESLENFLRIIRKLAGSAIMPKAESARALIVEDEPVIAFFLSELLNVAGIKNDIASNYDEAIALINMGQFELLFVDLGLPGRSGLEVIDVVQRDYPAMRIVISTGYGANVMQDSIIEQRGVYLLQKPYSVDDLKSVLAHCGFPVASHDSLES